MPTCVLVLGTPRSGTSAVAGVLSKLGIDMGVDYLTAFDMNPKGFFQCLRFEELFDGQEHYMPRVDLNADPEFAGRLAKVISAKCASGRDWGLKSGRLAFVLPTVLAACVHPVKLIVTERDRKRSKASWRQHVNDEDGNQTADEIIDEAGDAVERAVAKCGLTPLVVNHDHLCDEPEKIVREIAVFVGRPCTEAALSHVDASLRRH